jgi:putative transcription factor
MIEKSVFNVCLSCSRRGKSLEPSSSISHNTTGNSRNTIVPRGSNTGGTLSVRKVGPTGISPVSRNQYARRLRPAPIIKPPPLKRIDMLDEMILNHDFPSLIRNARNNKGLTHEQLGQKINEKVTVIRKIETGSIRPDEIIAKKLERFLGINLYVSADVQDNEEE